MATSRNKGSEATLAKAGVVLFAFGKPQYLQSLYNLAFSIKYHSPNMAVAAFVDSSETLHSYVPNAMSVIDSLGIINPEHLSTDGKFDPGKLKANIYEYLPFEHNIYLDVDAVAIKDIEPLMAELIETGKPYLSHTVGYHTIDKGRDFKEMQWAWADDVWQHFGLSGDTIMPAINSSLQYIRKGKESKALYSTLKKLYETNPMPLKKLRNAWGGGQPDELYMNVSLAKHCIDPAPRPFKHSLEAEDGYIHFAMRRGYSYEQVIERYYLQSYYGGDGFTARFYLEWLDRLLHKMMREKGTRHNFHIINIVKHKHANKK